MSYEFKLRAGRAEGLSGEAKGDFMTRLERYHRGAAGDIPLGQGALKPFDFSLSEARSPGGLLQYVCWWRIQGGKSEARRSD